MSTRSKGSRNELEYQRKLEGQGYITYRVKGATKFNKQVDIFGIADILAINDSEVLLVQVKTNSTSGALKQLKTWLEDHTVPSNVKLQVAVRKDGRGAKSAEWKIYDIDNIK
jgi:Holliday junction resolvase